MDHVDAAMTSLEFLAARSPDYLATDLKVASALFGAGLGKGWMERERFFELTHGIWSSLFFARAPGEDGGSNDARARRRTETLSFGAWRPPTSQPRSSDGTWPR